MIIAGTGHRPAILGLDYTPQSDKILRDFLIIRLKQIVIDSKVDAKWYEDDKCLVDGVVSGGSTGFDLAFAEAAFELEIPVTLAIPFEGFGSTWPILGQNRLWSAMTKSHRVHYVSEEKYVGPQQYLARDNWMVDNSDELVTLYSGIRKSGTGATVAYANRLKRPIINLWDYWTTYFTNLNAMTTCDVKGS